VKYVNKNLIIVVGMGLLLGVATSFGQTYLPDGFSQFANSYSVWLTFSFVAGLFAKTNRHALLYGVIVPVLALVGYYITSFIRFGAGVGSLAILLFWFIGGVTAGQVLAYLAFQWKQKEKWAKLAPIAVSSVIMSEGLYQLINLHYSIGYAFFVVSSVAFAVLYRKIFGIAYSLLRALGMSVVLYAVYALAEWLVSRV
jgi:hypothetical protein